jgi:hypothetical protein
VHLGGGMPSFFTELNRKRPPAALLDLVTFATSALVHAADDRSETEGLKALPSLARSTKSFWYEEHPGSLYPSFHVVRAPRASSSTACRRSVVHPKPLAQKVAPAANSGSSTSLARRWMLPFGTWCNSC